VTRQELDAIARDLVRAERELARQDAAAWQAVEEQEQRRWGWGLERRIDAMMAVAWEIDGLEGRFNHGVEWFRQARPASRHWLHELVRRVAGEREWLRREAQEARP
jgi:hypothetical protein